jgi:H+/Cl- antiporter ClcA
VITHLLGGSSGREGAALQLGGSISYEVGQFFHLDEKDMGMITLCGMSAVF